MAKKKKIKSKIIAKNIHFFLKRFIHFKKETLIILLELTEIKQHLQVILFFF